MTRRSPVTVYRSPIEMRHVRQKPSVSGGALLALAVMVAVYASIGWLLVRPRRHAVPAVSANVGTRVVAEPRAAEIEKRRTAWAPPAIRRELQLHPCNGCAP